MRDLLQPLADGLDIVAEQDGEADAGSGADDADADAAHQEDAQDGARA